MTGSEISEEILAAEAEVVVAEEFAEQLQRALDTRIVIEQTKGFIVGSYDVTPEAAFEAMRGYSRRNRVALRDGG